MLAWEAATSTADTLSLTYWTMAEGQRAQL